MEGRQALNAPRRLVVVKLGGSLITDKTRPSTPRPEVMERLAKEIAEALPELDGHLLLGHGSGSFGHVAASRCGLGKESFSPPRQPADEVQRRGLAETQDQAASLHRLVVSALLEAGLSPLGWAASSALTAREGKPRSLYIRSLLRSLEMGLLPVIYGDVVYDDAWGASICSTEQLISHLAGQLRRAGWYVEQLLWCGETDGIYDQEGHTVPRVDDGNIEAVRGLLTEARGVDVTGGMHLRLDTCRTLAKRGIASTLLNGTAPGQLRTALLGGDVTGTVVAAADDSPATASESTT